MTNQSEDIFDIYFALMENTESPYLYHRWCMISAIGALLGKHVYLPFGSENIYPHQYICLIGTPGSRKGSAINPMMKFMEEAGYEFFVGDRSSKGQFLPDWEYGFDRIHRGGDSKDKDNPELELENNLFEEYNDDRVSEAFVCAEELQDFLGDGNSGFISFLTKVWNVLPKYTDRLKNSKNVYIPNPILSLLGGATQSTFTNIFSSKVIGQGMLSRLLLIYGGGPRQKITIPPPLDPELREGIVKYLHKIRTEMHGICTLTEEAFTVADYIYKNQPELEDSRLAEYGSRRFIHLLKLAIVVTVADFRLEIEADDIIKANTILTYTENFMPKALGEFGKSKSSENTNTVLTLLESNPKGFTFDTVWKKTSIDFDKPGELADIMRKLKAAGKIEIDLNTERWAAVKKVLKNKAEYIDFSLLKEWREQKPELEPEILIDLPLTLTKE